MRFHLRIPQFLTSTVDVGRQPSRPVLDGHDVTVPNDWKLPPHTVALIGRPAVWFEIQVGPLHWEQDFGGHLLIAITGADATNATIIEAGPMHANGTGNLAPYDYPEDEFAERGVMDFEPMVIAPPNGMTEEFFAALVRMTQRDYDGDQRYVAIELPFLRVGRDSNSYAMGVLLSCGLDPREISTPLKRLRSEWTGYPGAEDPVHEGNFGAYFGAPAHLDRTTLEIAHHNADGSVRLVVVGGKPYGEATLADGTVVKLDSHGRIAFSPDDARAHGLPSRHTEPPAHIVNRRHFPDDPQPAGALITLVVDGRATPLEPGEHFRGTISERNDALGIVTLRSDTGDIVFSLRELGVEMRDPKRVDALFREGVELTVGLHSDRHPRLIVHGENFIKDRLTWRRFHAPRPINIVGTVVGVSVVVAAAAMLWRLRTL